LISGKTYHHIVGVVTTEYIPDIVKLLKFICPQHHSNTSMGCLYVLAVVGEKKLHAIHF
jgi:hypothetical protein